MSNQFISNVTVKDKIAEGNYGEVYSGKWNNSTNVALKKLKSFENLNIFVSEVSILMWVNYSKNRIKMLKFRKNIKNIKNKKFIFNLYLIIIY